VYWWHQTIPKPTKKETNKQQTRKERKNRERNNDRATGKMEQMNE
jgi:hypothetical protein